MRGSRTVVVAPTVNISGHKELCKDTKTLLTNAFLHLYRDTAS